MGDKAAGSGFEEIEHTADWAIRVWGDTMKDLLVAAAEGMLSLVGVDAAARQTSPHEVNLQAEDPEGLLVSWLEDLLFRLESKGLLPAEYLIEAGETWLRGQVIETRSTPVQKSIKAVTYHNLEVKQGPRGLEAQIVFDV